MLSHEFETASKAELSPKEKKRFRKELKDLGNQEGEWDSVHLGLAHSLARFGEIVFEDIQEFLEGPSDFIRNTAFEALKQIDSSRTAAIATRLIRDRQPLPKGAFELVASQDPKVAQKDLLAYVHFGDDKEAHFVNYLKNSRALEVLSEIATEDITEELRWKFLFLDDSGYSAIYSDSIRSLIFGVLAKVNRAEAFSTFNEFLLDKSYLGSEKDVVPEICTNSYRAIGSRVIEGFLWKYLESETEKEFYFGHLAEATDVHSADEEFDEERIRVLVNSVGSDFRSAVLFSVKVNGFFEGADPGLQKQVISELLSLDFLDESVRRDLVGYQHRRVNKRYGVQWQETQDRLFKLVDHLTDEERQTVLKRGGFGKSLPEGFAPNIETLLASPDFHTYELQLEGVTDEDLELASDESKELLAETAYRFFDWQLLERLGRDAISILVRFADLKQRQRSYYGVSPDKQLDSYYKHLLDTGKLYSIDDPEVTEIVAGFLPSDENILGVRYELLTYMAKRPNLRFLSFLITNALNLQVRREGKDMWEYWYEFITTKEGSKLAKRFLRMADWFDEKYLEKLMAEWKFHNHKRKLKRLFREVHQPEKPKRSGLFGLLR